MPRSPRSVSRPEYVMHLAGSVRKHATPTALLGLSLALLSACGTDDGGTADRDDDVGLLDAGGDATGDGAASDPAADPAPDAGPDAGEDPQIDPGADPQFDSMPDGVADAIGDPTEDASDNTLDFGDVLPPDVYPAICAEICGEIATNCGSVDLGGPCDEMCVEAMEEDPSWIASFICVQTSCNVGDCFPEEPLPLPDECVEMCDEIDACDMWDIFGDMPPEISICQAFCMGAIAGDENASEMLYCIADELDPDTCDREPLGLCFMGGLENICEMVCGPFDCPARSGFADAFGDVAGCVEHCTGLGTIERVAGLNYCLSVAQCGGADACLELPEETPAACVDTCDAWDSLCEFGPALDAPIDERAQCEWACAGVTTATGVYDPSLGADCFNGFDSCPGTPESEDGLIVMLGCMLPPVDACETLCESTFVPCDPNLEQAHCESWCSLLSTMTGGGFAGIVDCAENGDTCLESWSCLPDDPYSSEQLCRRHCEMQAECGFIDNVRTCEVDCQTSLDGSADQMANILCARIAQAETPRDTCDAISECLVSIPADDACVAACGETPEACSDWNARFEEGAACERTCSAVTSLTGTTGNEELIDCLVGELNSLCLAPDDLDCF